MSTNNESHLDVTIQERLRKVASSNQQQAAFRCASVYEEGRVGAVLLARESDFWRGFLDVIDGSRVPSRDEEFVLAYLRAPLEAELAAKAKAAAKKAANAEKIGASA